MGPGAAEHDDHVHLPDVMPARHPDVEVAEFDTEFVVFDPRCNQVHLLHGSAAVVFDACDGITPTAAVLSECGEFLQVDVEGLAEMLAGSLTQMAQLGLLSDHRGVESDGWA